MSDLNHRPLGGEILKLRCLKSPRRGLFSSISQTTHQLSGRRWRRPGTRGCLRCKAGASRSAQGEARSEESFSDESEYCAGVRRL